MFILELTLRSWNHSEENKRRTLQRNDIAAAITRTDIFDFLVSTSAVLPAPKENWRCCAPALHFWLVLCTAIIMQTHGLTAWSAIRALLCTHAAEARYTQAVHGCRWTSCPVMSGRTRRQRGRSRPQRQQRGPRERSRPPAQQRPWRRQRPLRGDSQCPQVQAQAWGLSVTICGGLSVTATGCGSSLITLRSR